MKAVEDISAQRITVIHIYHDNVASIQPSLDLSQVVKHKYLGYQLKCILYNLSQHQSHQNDTIVERKSKCYNLYQM